MVAMKSIKMNPDHWRVLRRFRQRSELYAWDTFWSQSIDTGYVNHKLIMKDRWHHLILHMLNQAKLDLCQMRILEVGCGFGTFCLWLSQTSREVTGIDITHTGLAVGVALKHQYQRPVDFILADGSKLPMQKASYDMVICTETLEHVPNYTRVFDEIVRVVTPEGYIVITVPNCLNITPFDPSYALKTKLIGESKGQPDDINHFTIWTLKELLRTRHLKTIIQQGIGLLQLPSRRHAAQKIQQYLDQPLNILKPFSLNIGIIAQKQLQSSIE